MDTERQMLETLLRRTRNMERLMLLLLRGEGELLMDSAAAIALLESAVTVINTLKAEESDSLDNPAVASALNDLEAAVQNAQTSGDSSGGAGSQVPPGDGTGDSTTTPAPGDGSETPAV